MTILDRASRATQYASLSIDTASLADASAIADRSQYSHAP